MTAEIPCAIKVAKATPFTPRPNCITNTKSRKIFSRDEKISRYRGVRESPRELNTEACTLYINKNGSPRK